MYRDMAGKSYYDFNLYFYLYSIFIFILFNLMIFLVFEDYLNLMENHLKNGKYLPFSFLSLKFLPLIKQALKIDKNLKFFFFFLKFSFLSFSFTKHLLSYVCKLRSAHVLHKITLYVVFEMFFLWFCNFFFVKEK